MHQCIPCHRLKSTAQLDSLFLEKRPGVCDVSLSNNSPAERHKIVAWEQRNTCMLPDDLKNFFLTTNGLLLTWKVNVEGDYFKIESLYALKAAEVKE